MTFRESPVSRLLSIAIVGLVLVVVAIVLNFAPWQTNETTPTSITSESLSPESKLPPALKLEPPTFDVVRVSPNGNTVIAGRAMPDSLVISIDNDEDFGRTRADDRGDWVMVPEEPLKPGSHTLRLKMLVGSESPIYSIEDVVVVVPQPGEDIAGRRGDGNVLALKLNPDGSSTVLQKPGGRGTIKLSVDSVDYDDDGRLSISGSSHPNAMVQIYVNNKLIGHARASDDKGAGYGLWKMNPDETIEPGLYTLRADQIDTDGKVIQRISFPFSRAEPTRKIKNANKIVVQPGNSLWRIARSRYGKGNHYTIIFEANKDQIKDPDLIYPGQVFKLSETKGKN